ncbi:MAG: ABC transporter ATP-binding protein [Anaerolineae bacterium]|nr:ABC transporter ATP-binding protein [Anaerolineae bacterium]
MNNNKILYTQDLSIHFGGLVAVDRVNIEVQRNTILGLIGPNGSGKTTIFNMLTGLYIPTGGNFFFEGESLLGKPPYEIARKGIARTFQSSRLCLDLSVLDNVFIGMHPRQKHWLTSAVFRRSALAEEVYQAYEKAMHLLNIFNPELVKRSSEPAGRLPQIDRRRVEICRAMAMSPKLLLLDEPSAGMTPEEITELMNDIRKVQQESEDITIIIVEHVMSVIRTITDHVVVLNFGRKIAEGTFHEISHNPEVREAYLGKRG